jgi:hypothetical protein
VQPGVFFGGGEDVGGVMFAGAPDPRRRPSTATAGRSSSRGVAPAPRVPVQEVMAGFMKSIQKFARSPQGKKTISEAERVAKDPATKEKVRGVRDRFAARRGGSGDAGPTGGDAPR